jgi:hypothetical protein
MALMEDFLGQLFGSSARAKVLRAFVFDPRPFTAALTAKRSGVSSRIAQQEIRALEKIGVIKRAKFSITLGQGSGKKVVAGKQKEAAWALDPEFRHAAALSKFVHEVSPVQHKHIIAGLRRAGRIAAVVLSGAFVGDASRPADLIIAGDGVNENKLEAAVKALEPQLGREIRYAAFTTPEFRYRMTIQDRLLRDTLDFPHLVLLDKTRLL